MPEGTRKCRKAPWVFVWGWGGSKGKARVKDTQCCLSVPWRVIHCCLFVRQVQPGPRAGVCPGCGAQDWPGDHEPLRRPAGLRGPGQCHVAREAAAAAAQPQRQHPVDPRLHGQGRQAACRVGQRAHPEAPRQRAYCIPLSAPAARRPRVSGPGVREGWGGRIPFPAASAALTH